MVEVKNVEVYGLSRAVNAIRNSYTVGVINTKEEPNTRQWKTAAMLGCNAEPHQSHDAYLKGVTVVFDIKYPQYWSPEFQRYHFSDIIMSQSTMHSLEKFLSGELDPYNKYVTELSKEQVRTLYKEWCKAKEQAKSNKCETDTVYKAFMRLRSNIPCGFEMWETVTTNYLQLKTIWIQRHNHPLVEDWQNGFCRDFIEQLPRFKELALGENAYA